MLKYIFRNTKIQKEKGEEEKRKRGEGREPANKVKFTTSDIQACNEAYKQAALPFFERRYQLNCGS